MQKSAKKQYLVPAIKRCFEVIDLIADNDEGLTVSEIHRALRLPLSSAAGIVYTLQALSYIDKDQDSGRYTLGTKLYSLSGRFNGQSEIVRRCHTVVENLASEAGLTTHVAIKHKDESMYIDRVAGPGLMQFSSYVGMCWPLHASGVGKVLLAFLPAEELTAALKSLSLTRFTKHTVTNRQNLEKQLRQVRQLGYGWEINEGEDGVACIAAPIFGYEKNVIAAVSVTGSTHQIDEDRIPSLGILVKKFADQMSKRMGPAAPNRHA